MFLKFRRSYRTRVSNELGTGNAWAARVVAATVVFLAVLESVIVSLTLYAARNAFGYIFNDEKEAVDYVTNMAPLIWGFWLDIRGKGLWIGILAGSFLQASLLSVITISTAWEDKVHPPFFLGSFNLFCLASQKLQTFTFDDPKWLVYKDYTHLSSYLSIQLNHNTYLTNVISENLIFNLNNYFIDMS